MSTTEAAQAVRVDPVRGRRDLKRFLEVPWPLYAHDPAWVPPLLVEQRKLLDPSHPFHAHADVALFLARRGGREVGRIAAVVNHRHNEVHEERTGFFGFFETVEDPAVAEALLRTAEEWLRERGMDRCRGPVNLSTNEECGLLVEGFGEPPMVMMTHNPPYYADLLERAGYGKAMDMLAYMVDDPEPARRLGRGAERIRRRYDYRVRPLDMKRFDRDVEVIRSLYNQAWSHNWGFVPMTDAEFDRMGRDLKKIVDPRICLLAESEGEAVGFILALPDLNQALARIDGRLFPFGLLKLLWYSRRIDQIRVITLGVLPEHRRRGVSAILVSQVIERGLEAGYRRAECSWVLETNTEMRNALERSGGRVYKTYRLYEKPL